MDRDEEVGGRAVGDRDALPEGECLIGGARQLNADAARAQAVGDPVGEQEGELLLVEAGGAARARVGAAVAGVENDEAFGRGPGWRRLRRCESRVAREAPEEAAYDEGQRLHDM